MADQESVAAGAHEAPPDLRQHVVRHVLLVPETLSAGRRPGERCVDLSPVRLVMLQDLVAHRMVEAGQMQIGRVERLVGLTAQSGRLPKERISAVERFRGPDHMAIRTGSWSAETGVASLISRARPDIRRCRRNCAAAKGQSGKILAPLGARVGDGLLEQHVSDAPAAQRFGNIGVVDDDQALARARERHLGDMAVDRHAIDAAGRTVLALDLDRAGPSSLMSSSCPQSPTSRSAHSGCWRNSR